MFYELQHLIVMTSNININLKYYISVLLLWLIKLAIFHTTFNNKLLGEEISTYMNCTIYLIIITLTISINSKYPVSILILPYS